MPIEIRELVIKAVVDQQDRQSAPEAEETGQKKQQQVVRESVEQVMDILERRKER